MITSTTIKVYICNLAGEYLTGAGDDWLFTRERAIAHIFDYHADQVALQLAQAQRDHGVAWIAYPVEPSLISETCDACGQQMRTNDAIFDGTHFLCLGCRTKNVASSDC